MCGLHSLAARLGDSFNRAAGQWSTGNVWSLSALSRWMTAEALCRAACSPISR